MATDKERLAVVETNVKSLQDDVNDLQKVNTDNQGRLIKAIWGLLRLTGIVMMLTFLTEMAKDGCRICRAIISSLGGQQ